MSAIMLAAQLVGAGQVGAHPVEGLRQRAQFIRRAHGDLLPQLPAGHGLDGVGQVAHRLGEGTGQDDPQEHGDHHRAERGQRQGSIDARQVLGFAVVQRRRTGRVQHRPNLTSVYFDCFSASQILRDILAGAIRPHRGDNSARLVHQHKRARSGGCSRLGVSVRLTEVVSCAVPRPVRLVIGHRIREELTARPVHDEAVKLAPRDRPGEHRGQTDTDHADQ